MPSNAAPIEAADVCPLLADGGKYFHHRIYSDGLFHSAMMLRDATEELNHLCSLSSNYRRH